jgi:integrase
MRTPQGHIRQRGGIFEIAVPLGRDPVTGRYRYAYDYADTAAEAQAKKAALVGQITQGRTPQVRATVNDLLDRWLEVAELELNTRASYEGYVERVIRPVLGRMRLRELEVRVDILDVLYAELRRCRRLCGGRPMTDHRPVGRGRRKADGEPDHECDDRCRPHQCRPLEPASVAQIHSILRRACNFAVKWRWMNENPARLATVPRNIAEIADPPTPDEAVRLLAAAEEHGDDLQVVVEFSFPHGGALLVPRVPRDLQSCAADGGEQAAERLKLALVVTGAETRHGLNGPQPGGQPPPRWHRFG